MNVKTEKQTFFSKFKAIFSAKRNANKSGFANGFLLFFTVVTIFIVPISPVKYLELLFTISVTGIVVFAVLSLRETTYYIKGFAVFSSIIVWSSFFIEESEFRSVFRFINFFFFLYLVFTLIKQIASIKTVTFKVIVDAITGYLLLGFAYSLIVTVISLSIPESYNITINQGVHTKFLDPIQNNIYYTFVTYTSTGYGDVTPTHPLSKSFSVLISISGQLYLTVIIAMLIGKYISLKKTD
jgi:voltage-gated potassium channel